jgi:hypothetical protein
MSLYVNISIFTIFMTSSVNYDLMISVNEHISDNTGGKDYSCNSCNDKAADIFQADGDYCLDCWQKRTYPNL